MPLLLALLFLPWLAWANPVTTEHVTARLLAEHQSAAPGQPAELLLVLEIQPHWHTYWRNPGDSGEAPRVEWTLPAGVTAGPLGFPHPELIRVGPLANYGYSGRALHPVTIQVPADWPVGEPLALRAAAQWLVCEEFCVPESAVLDLTLPTAAVPGPADPASAEPFAATRAGLPTAHIAGAVLEAAPAAAGGGLRLSVPWTGPLPAEVWYFPGVWGLIDHAAPQPWRADAGRLLIDLTPGAASGQADPDGVLVTRADDGRVQSLTLSLTVPSVAPTDPAQPLGLALALGMAFLGGLILNLMPCVFPVLAIKALGLAQQGGLSTAARVGQGLAYTAGVLVFFGLIAGLLLALRAGGAAVGWGFQLQYPPVVAGLAYLFLVLGLSLAGAVTLGGRLMGLAGGALPGRHGHGHGPAEAFWTGALAALVAAPCTAPFMGAALGYAVTLPWLPALAILLTLGLGLAAPFLLVSAVPFLARRLPRPGAWMDTLKQLLAFPMFATAAWLVWVLSVQTGPTGVALVLTGLLMLSFGLWLRERTALGSDRRRLAGGAAALAALAVALWLAVLTAHSVPVAPSAAGGGTHANGLVSESYTPERLAAARAEGRPVFVNMTAAWCITCLVNERVALDTAAVAAAFARGQVRYLKGDWTNRDAAITDYLAGFGRNGVPLYVFYPPGEPPRVLPQILTPAGVIAALTPTIPPNQSQSEE